MRKMQQKFKKGLALLLALCFALSFGLTFKPMEVKAEPAPIREVAISFTAPVPGEEPKAVTTTTDGVSIVSYEWKDRNGKLGENDTFKYNTEYLLGVTISTTDSFVENLAVTPEPDRCNVDDERKTANMLYSLTTPKAGVEMSEKDYEDLKVALRNKIDSPMFCAFFYGISLEDIKAAMPTSLTLTMQDGTKQTFNISVWEMKDGYAYDSSTIDKYQSFYLYPVLEDNENYDMKSINDEMPKKVSLNISVYEKDGSHGVMDQNYDEVAKGDGKDITIKIDAPFREFAELYLYLVPEDIAQIFKLIFIGDEISNQEEMMEYFQNNLELLLRFQEFMDEFEEKLANDEVPPLDKDKYTVEEGSTIITLPATTIAALQEGFYIAIVEFIDSNNNHEDTLAYLTINSGSSTDDNGENNQPSNQGGADPAQTDTTTNVGAKAGTTPKTGDSNNIWLFAGLVMLSIGGALITVKSKKAVK